MEKLPLVLVLLGCAMLGTAQAQGAPPLPPVQPGPHEAPRGSWRDLTPKQRERWREWREERRQQRDFLREMSPEERHQLRRDIREAGRFYRRGPRREW
ncbi:MAG: hypothetical protein ACK4Q4_02850 [Rhodocyclaceae bacterium]